MPPRPSLYHKYSTDVSTSEYDHLTLDDLTKKQAKFVQLYLERLAPFGQALIQLVWDAGYNGTADCARGTASRNLGDEKVLAVMSNEYNKRKPGVSIKSKLRLESKLDTDDISHRDQATAAKELLDRNDGPVASRGSAKAEREDWEDLLDDVELLEAKHRQKNSIEGEVIPQDFEDEQELLKLAEGREQDGHNLLQEDEITDLEVVEVSSSCDDADDVGSTQPSPSALQRYKLRVAADQYVSEL